MSRPPTAADFAVLGLHPGAGEDEIRAAYRRLAKIHHPDRNPGSVEAKATFQRLTESYAALQSRQRSSGRPGTTPLSAALARRRRASSRRGQAAEQMGLGQLPVGGALWVDADAVLVAPDRAAALQPAASGSAFPTAQRVIRVERRADGFHVFMPPQPSARWPVSAAAETDGLAVAALWVGDRQDRGPDDTIARLPLRLITMTVGEMAVDETGWVAREALAVDAAGSWSIDLAQPVGHEPHRATPVRVLRDADGFRVHSDIPAAAWPPGGPAAPAAGAVVTALLAGVAHQAPPPARA
ncbi:MAG: J domain-containing protein [Candidatus Dormibacteria bacterium]